MISITEFLQTAMLDEARVVPFVDAKGKQAKFGQCIILAGGPGTGKGYIRQNYLNTDYKVFNVDDLKGLYLDMVKAGYIKDEKEYDFKNTEDVAELHAKVKNKGWKEKERDRVFNNATNTERLPNICFDVTCKDIDDLNEILTRVVPLGYKVTLVWVVGNVDVASENNKKRNRTVPEKLLRGTHAAVNEFLPDLLSGKYKGSSRFIDAAYIALSAGRDHVLGDEWKNSPIIPLKKAGDAFDYDEVKDKVEKFISEEQPLDEK